MHRLPFALSALALLAACGSDPEPKSPDEVIAAAQNLIKPEPGLYTTSAEVIEFDVPGLPPAQADRIKAMAGGMMSQDQSFCLTPDEAEKGFEDVVRQMGEGQGEMNCTFSRFEADGGNLDAVLDCKGPQGAKATMAMDGTMTPTSSQMTMDMTQSAAAIPGGEMKMKMKMSSKRTGDCPAG